MFQPFKKVRISDKGSCSALVPNVLYERMVCPAFLSLSLTLPYPILNLVMDDMSPLHQSLVGIIVQAYLALLQILRHSQRIGVAG
jgi:hypothetical protein